MIRITKRALIKGIVWESIGVLSLGVCTGNWTFSVIYVLYRTLTFPIFDAVWKRFTRKQQDITQYEQHQAALNTLWTNMFKPRGHTSHGKDT